MSTKSAPGQLTLGDMEGHVFEGTSYGKVALRKLRAAGYELGDDFRLYVAGWQGNKPEDWTHMKVTGATFRRAEKGPRKGRLCFKVPGTDVSALVSRKEMQAQEARDAKAKARAAKAH